LLFSFGAGLEAGGVAAGRPARRPGPPVAARYPASLIPRLNTSFCHFLFPADFNMMCAPQVSPHCKGTDGLICKHCWQAISDEEKERHKGDWNKSVGAMDPDSPEAVLFCSRVGCWASVSKKNAKKGYNTCSLFLNTGRCDDVYYSLGLLELPSAASTGGGFADPPPPPPPITALTLPARHCSSHRADRDDLYRRLAQLESMAEDLKNQLKELKDEIAE